MTFRIMHLLSNPLLDEFSIYFMFDPEIAKQDHCLIRPGSLVE